jgi:hypothetical protein
VFVLIFR